MTHRFEPFTPELFKQQTGLDASDNEAIYVRWVNTQVNYANYQSMQEMTKALNEIVQLLRENKFQLVKR